jgi:hypothetical protein
MIVTIIQGLWKECNNYFLFIMKVLVAIGLWKEGNKNNFFIIVKLLAATWHSEISDYVLNLQAYLH